MYSREESQQIKKQFWIAFAEKYPRKWILYNTKIKDFTFKFYVDNKKAQVLLDIENKEDTKRFAYYEKLESLKNILSDEFIKNIVYEKNYFLENGKSISRIWVEKNNVSSNNRNNWDEIFDFFNEKMNSFELFFSEYDEYIKEV